MSYLSVRNWNHYQHYKTRRPVWIKLHLELLDDHQIRALPYPTRLLWDQLLLLAGKYANAIPNDLKLISGLTGIEPEDCREGIHTLLKGRWLREKRTTRTASKRASNPASHSASPEVEKEKEKPSAVQRPVQDPRVNGETNSTGFDYDLTTMLEGVDARIRR